jgi:hypothetical protein
MTAYKTFIDTAPWLTPKMLATGSTETRTINPEDWQQSGHGDQIDEQGLENVLARIIDATGDDPPPTSDASASFEVHRHLKISRRAASDRELWIFLNVTVGWRYIAWRWAGHEGTVTRERVAGDLSRSTLARLWWMAELSRGNVDEPLTEEEHRERIRILVRKQDMSVALYERPRLFGRAPLAPALLDAASHPAWKENPFRDFAARCVGHFGVRLPAAMTPDQIGTAVQQQARGLLESE